MPNEKVLGNLVNALLPEYNPLINSGLVARAPEVDAVVSGGSRKQGLAFINPLAADEANTASDDLSVQGAYGKLTADEFNAIRLDRNYGWGTSDLTRMVTQYDVKGGIQAGIAAYWARQFELTATSAMVGALAAAPSLTVGDGTAAFDTDLIIDATVEAGEYMDLFDVLIVSPATKAKMMKMNSANTFVRASDNGIKIDTWGGYKLITSKAFGDDTTIVARSGAIAFGEGVIAGEVPFEVERVANGGNGQGGDILHSRRSYVVHPQGFSYKATNVAPTNANLEAASAWELAVDAEMVGFRAISHLA
ncbi:hypothetical protein GRI62_11855 [Erythrobacter arachoides]|uniref:Phage capsid protein n=1 Tax=Aurantiacibacter arachoides TaxID=1850444 RepID=A0A845A3R8_9SPHN|nr:hypothetical protein [Aurantiacibacter arachoides]MXO94290.1 hypothetical protein [Aurantiacibacter arachoides]